MRLQLVGLLLLVGGATSCLSGEAACHQRAVALLGCCPFCDEDCEVSKNADAKFAEDSCLAELEQQRQAQEGRLSEFDATQPGGNDATSGVVWDSEG